MRPTPHYTTARFDTNHVLELGKRTNLTLTTHIFTCELFAIFLAIEPTNRRYANLPSFT